MKPLVLRTRNGERTTPSRAVRPCLEGLEDRLLLYSATGDHFTYGNRITWSIVPDGTNLGGVNSNFVSTMNAKFGSGNWIQAIDDAFAQWENVANVNLVQVGDDGAPTGAGYLQQGSSEFGDIRIGGYFQASNILAYTLLPPAANGGSDSGDIFFNTAQNWNIGSDYDLETVMVHEIGHAVAGLADETTNPNAVEFTYYNGIKQSPSNDDIAGIQAVWGPRAQDGIGAGTSNFNSNRAATITQFTNSSNDQIVLPNQDVAVTGQLYWFKFTTPANASSNLTIQIQSQYLSELSPMVQLYNGYGQGLVQTAASTNAYGTTIDASISNATPNSTYYVRVSGSSTNANGTGAYAMTVNMGNSGIALVGPPNTQVAAQPDQGPGGAYQLIGSTLPTLTQLQSMGDYFNFSPNTTGSGGSSGSGYSWWFPWFPGSSNSNPNAAVTSAGFTNASLNTWVTTSNVPNVPGVSSINLSNLGALVANLPSILIGLETPNYNSGLLNF